MKLSILIPAYNENLNIETVVKKTAALLSEFNMSNDAELILINDGSTDGTGPIMDKMSASYTNVRALHHSKNRGLGAALKTGMAAAQGAYVTFIPADGEVEASQALHLLTHAGDADLVVSTRRCPRELQQLVRSWYRDLLSHGMHVLTRLIMGFNPAKMDGIFIVRNDVLKKMHLVSGTGALCLEIILCCHKGGYKIINGGFMEVSPRLSGTSKIANLKSIVKVFMDLFSIRISHLRRINH